MMARLRQPLNTIRRIQVVVPSRAQFEPGFYRWLERLSRIAENLECRIEYHGRKDTLDLISQYIQNRHPEVRAAYTEMEHWNELPQIASTIESDHLFVVVTARKGTESAHYIPRSVWRCRGDDLCTVAAHRGKECLGNIGSVVGKAIINKQKKGQ